MQPKSHVAQRVARADARRPGRPPSSCSNGASPIIVLQEQYVRFEWDPEKSASNRRKHGVTFDEAASWFADPRGCYFRNEAPSYEDRLILIAFSEKARLLFVVHAEVGR